MKKQNSGHGPDGHPQRVGGSEHNGSADDGKGNAMPYIPDRVVPKEDPVQREMPGIQEEDETLPPRQRKASPVPPKDGGLAEDDPDAEIRT